MKKLFSSYWMRAALFTFLQRFSLTFFGFMNLVLLTRMLSIAQMSTWALFLTITTIFEMTKSNLLKNAHIKYVGHSEDEQEKIVVASSSLLINAALTLFFLLLIVFFSRWLGHWFNTGKELAEMLWWFIPGMIFMIFFAHLEAVQQSFMDFKGGFGASFVRQTTFFAIILSYKLSGAKLTLAQLSMYQSATIGLGTVVMYILTKKYLLMKFSPSRVWVKRILGYGGYIFGSGMVANISNNLDQLMTGKFISATSIAYYNVASRINLLVDIPSFAAAEVIFPKASRVSGEGAKDQARYLFERMVSVLLAFTIPTALVVILVPGLVMTVIAGPAYRVAAPILQLYMITGILRPAQNQAANMLNSIGKPKLVFWANSVYFVLYLFINYLCLSWIGFYGAAVGTLITSFIGFIGWYFIMRSEIGLVPGQVVRYVGENYKLIYSKVKSAVGNLRAS